MVCKNYSRETFLGRISTSENRRLVELGMHPYEAQRAEAHFRKLDNAMLKELLPQHSEDKELSAKSSKEARKELEEIFGREMESDRQTPNHWE